MKKLSVIISNRNDVAMLAITVRSCLEELNFLDDQGEVVIVDNSDPGIYGQLASVLPTGYCRDRKLRVYQQDFPCLFSARQTAVEESLGEYIICLDSHMIVGHDCFKDLLAFMENHSSDDHLGFAHAPICWLHQHERTSKHDRDMSVCELGDWNTQYDHERKITWKGMPWICRREWFLNTLGGYGALAKHHISWGGGDMHIGVKPWLLGYANWAVPTRPCYHIGPFPSKGKSAHKYRLYTASGKFPSTFGFLVSCYILGGEAMMSRNKPTLDKRFGSVIDTSKWWERAKEIGEEEKAWLDERKVITFEDLLETKPWNENV